MIVRDEHDVFIGIGCNCCKAVPSREEIIKGMGLANMGWFINSHAGIHLCTECRDKPEYAEIVEAQRLDIERLGHIRAGCSSRITDAIAA